MDNSASDRSPRAPATGARARASAAFSVLGNQTRLAILLALWEAYEPFAEENAVPFSELRERVGVRDSGQFNYHLDKLVGDFVRKTDGGYELRRAGQQLVRTVIAGTGIEKPTFETTQLDKECDFCGAPTAVMYRDEWIYIVCTECEGFFDERAERPFGTLSGVEFDPAGFADRTPGEMFHAAWIAALQHVQSAIEGVCDECSGRMTTSLHICDDHAAEGVCPTCGSRSDVMARFRCIVCKNHHEAPPRTIVAHHPAVIAFYYDHGVPFLYDLGDFEHFKRRGELVGAHEQELIAEDPPRIRVTVRYEADTLELILDEELNVVELSTA